MNLYRLTQHERYGFGTYDAYVVAARTLDDATKIHPEGTDVWAWPQNITWASNPEKINAEYIGKAATGTARGVILASYNEG